jgi:hypothetical protein
MTRLLSVTVLCFALVVPVLAQSADKSKVRADHNQRATELQIKQSLENDDAEVQRIQLRNTIALATLHRNDMDFSQSVPAIVRIHKTSDDELMRSRAVAALQVIGSLDALRYLDRYVTADEKLLSRAAMIEALHAVQVRQLTRN